MALSWLTALKAVPWTDVMQAAPALVQGARKLFNAAKATAAEKPAQDEGIGARVQRIEQTMEALQTEQRASADLIRSLAEQNASIVGALDQLRKRIRILAGSCALLVLGVGVLAVLVFSRL